LADSEPARLRGDRRDLPGDVPADAVALALGDQAAVGERAITSRDVNRIDRRRGDLDEELLWSRHRYRKVDQFEVLRTAEATDDDRVHSSNGMGVTLGWKEGTPKCVPDLGERTDGNHDGGAAA